MICPICKKNNEKSTVNDNGGMSTLMGFITTYDEEGNEHHHDRNRITTHYSCSNGHTFKGMRKGSPCPSYPDNCDFGGGEEELIF